LHGRTVHLQRGKVAYRAHAELLLEHIAGPGDVLILEAAVVAAREHATESVLKRLLLDRRRRRAGGRVTAAGAVDWRDSRSEQNRSISKSQRKRQDCRRGSYW